MKKGTSHLLKRAEHFKTILTAEGFLVGIVAGLVVLLYRVLLEYAGRGMNLVLEYARKYPALLGGWFLALFVLACIVGKLVNLPMIPLYKPEKLPPPSTYSLFSEIAVTIFPKYSSKTQSCMPLCCRTDVPTGTL